MTYCPHLTVGNVEQPSVFDSALEELGNFAECFNTVIDRVYVENIDASEQSSIEQAFDLE